MEEKLYNRNINAVLHHHHRPLSFNIPYPLQVVVLLYRFLNRTSSEWDSQDFSSADLPGMSSTSSRNLHLLTVNKPKKYNLYENLPAIKQLA